MANDNPYQQYAEGNLLSGNPLNLVVALYEGAIDATRTALVNLESGDTWGRSKGINKAVSILTELMVSLDKEKGGEIAGNLKELYSYMQRRLLEAHVKKSAAPIKEVQGLLTNLVDGWKQAAASVSAAERESMSLAAACPAYTAVKIDQQSAEECVIASYGYGVESAELHANAAYSFY